ncbi:tyrosine-type recombinase/integrase [Jannaschia ovalis]|uniref:Tyrosine-type recombinase/integrase n=1 Tax=Jannaschia ovalis TaxID=3038773 RepID=A0ABY8L7Y5_9RHOB|nr:site-specific integrase [Jannaschia sp. GRR-S6-38]WGH77483.1 tyrosine-type recombinase/integrase [Jannaschia sp. GRR-S6-38]
MPERGNQVTYDDALRGFGLRVTAKGVRSFVLNYRVKGRERRITIGSYPAWSVAAARKQAEEYRRRISLGDDPLEERKAARDAETVKDLFARYAAEHLPTKAPRSAADDRAMWAKDILPALGPRKVTDLTAADCDKLHRMISVDRPTRANRVIEVLRKALNLAIRWGWIERNPATGVRRNAETKRMRYLDREEIARLNAALSEHPQRASADAIQFLLLTGCRRGEALGATWDQFDLERRVWTKPSTLTKQRRVHRVPYSKAVATILERRRAEAGGTFIFSGSLGAPLVDVKRTWASVCKTAGLSGVRIHDLRHTYASLLASSGVSLPVVGALLGHSQPQTTARYAHLYDDTLRAATQSVADTIG